MKHYTIRCAYCGATIPKYEAYLKLYFIFKDTYTLHCPVCHKQSKWITNFVLKHDTTNREEKLFNKTKLFDDRL